MENKLIMLKTLLKFLDLNKSLWQNSVPFVNAVAQLRALIVQIDATRLIADEDYTGQTDQKTDLQDALINKAFSLVSIVRAMASSTKNKVLLAKVDYPISELQRLRYDDLASSCRGISSLIRENMVALTDYPVNEAVLTAYEEQIALYENGLPTHRISVSERKAANAKLKTLNKEADDVLVNQINTLMVPYGELNPDFYASYLNARKVIDYGTRYEKGDDPENGSNISPSNP